MAACYHEDATFSDIAFRLKDRNEIRSMWHMICTKGIDVKVDCVLPDEDSVRASDHLSVLSTVLRIRRWCVWWC